MTIFSSSKFLQTIDNAAILCNNVKGRTSVLTLNLSFLHSKSYYIILLIAAAGVQADYILTIEGLSSGYVETRSFFWLHFASLFALITLVYFVMHPFNRKTATLTSLAIALVMPALPIASNVMVLVTGRSPLV